MSQYIILMNTQQVLLFPLAKENTGLTTLRYFSNLTAAKCDLDP